MRFNANQGFRTVMTFLANRQWHAARPLDKRFGERRSPRRGAHHYPDERRRALLAQM